MKDVVQLHRDLFIPLEMRLYDDELWAQALGHLNGLCGMHAKASGLIAGSRYYTTFSIVTNSYGFALQFRIVALLHSGKELVHVHMNNLHHAAKVRNKREIWKQMKVLDTKKSGEP